MEQDGKEGSANPNAANQLQNQPPPAGDVKRPNSPPPHLKCARCDSSNTKFCYYNNYSRSQPRYFCRACRRYWTHGGTLRNVPIGGGARGKRRPLRIRPAAVPVAAAPASAGQSSKALEPAMPEPPAPMVGNAFYGGGSFLPAFSASQFGANLSLLQAMTLQSLKPPAVGNLFPAQQNLIAQPIRTWAPNMNATGSSSAGVGPSFMDQAGPSCSDPNEWLADNRQG